ncbi:MAG TPA: M3 family metallopeptidase, partial [Elusimicrobiota bacterium]|nr:M3 family metallopeptidase [Elusimicrobiota bacterium]
GAARAAVDLALHSLRPPKDVARLIDRIFVRFGLRPPPAGHAYQASFGHLMGPYAAGYYTYLTSLNRALDLYSRVGPAFADPAAGRDYRREILAPGGERGMDEAARAFLGREPDPRALERFLSGL